MKMTGLGVLATLACAMAGEPGVAADAQKRGDHRAARAARVEGRILPLREIERRVVPRMRGARYLGFDFDSGTTVYTLKFLRDGNVIWVDVDGRSGQVLGQSGN
ncbi:PepSY domain-containing protein [Sphingomonas sp.]|uniref:PepSY domain-containing protein n=1 Tax=Sphingomonas sp. TaxID=28214 RepID=UPI002BFED9AC|nr:PepSY domain-containing protein [Sphingomonas sp.]HTG39808.1 PepSY domain-containing protein [Sphingomonas sp.]